MKKGIAGLAISMRFMAALAPALSTGRRRGLSCGFV